MRGPAAIATTAAACGAAFLLAGVVSFAAQARAPGGPATVSSWARGAVGAPGAHREAGEMLFDRFGCRGCHSLDGVGAHVGPALDHVRLRKSHEAIVTWLDDPQKIKPGTVMPTFHLTPAEEQMLADYLYSK